MSGVPDLDPIRRLAVKLAKSLAGPKVGPVFCRTETFYFSQTTGERKKVFFSVLLNIGKKLIIFPLKLTNHFFTRRMGI